MSSVSTMLNVTLASLVYALMHIQGDKNAFMTSVLWLVVMIARDDIVKSIKEKP